MQKAPRYDREEVARRGDEIYEREVLPQLGPEDAGKFTLIDIDTGDYEVDRDEVAASDRLLARRPDAQVWMRQVGFRYARRLRYLDPSQEPIGKIVGHRQLSKTSPGSAAPSTRRRPATS